MKDSSDPQIVERIATKAIPSRSAMTDGFYESSIAELVKSGALDPHARTLVVCGGEFDRNTLLAAGFSDVTISNLDPRTIGDGMAPFRWAFQDAEALTFRDGEFEQVIEHNGLHHCASPHRALLEMYRVASNSVVVFEPRDSFALQVAVRLGLTGMHEVETVIDHALVAGGVRNTGLPNYVFRWTEREVEKTIGSFDPSGKCDFKFFHGLAPSFDNHRLGRSVKQRMMRLCAPLARLLFLLIPNQGNRFCFYVGKPRVAYPWVNATRDGMSPDWVLAQKG